jgi:multidrug efflux pump subunit AcrB
MSLEGAVIGVLKVDPDYSTDEVLEEVRNAVNIIPDLPMMQILRSFPKLQIPQGLLLNLHFHMMTSGTSKYATELQDHIETYSNIASVELEGIAMRSLMCELTPIKLLTLRLVLAKWSKRYGIEHKRFCREY